MAGRSFILRVSETKVGAQVTKRGIFAAGSDPAELHLGQPATGEPRFVFRMKQGSGRVMVTEVAANVVLRIQAG